VVAISPAISQDKAPFRWKYVILPALFLVVTIILAACFFPLLSSEVAYHFSSDMPDRFISRGAFIFWVLIPQLLFTLLAFGIVRLISLTARHFPPEGSPLDDILTIMGNIWALPQLVIIFAMVEFFLYNAYQIQLISLWIVVVIILAIGAIALVILFMRAIRRARQRQAKLARSDINARKK
jgi:uncharacterized membrane protein